MLALASGCCDLIVHSFIRLLSYPYSGYLPEHRSVIHSLLQKVAQYNPIVISPRIRAVKCISASRSNLIPSSNAASLGLPFSSTGPLMMLPAGRLSVADDGTGPTLAEILRPPEA